MYNIYMNIYTNFFIDTRRLCITPSPSLSLYIYVCVYIYIIILIYAYRVTKRATLPH